jgi:hypothetical protein
MKVRTSWIKNIGTVRFYRGIANSLASLAQPIPAGLTFDRH